VHVNRDFIKEPDLKSSAQLTDQKFKGKIVILTPTGGATQQSLGHMAFMYGENFIRELLSKQEVIVTDDNRQQVEWLVRGKYPISIGFDRTLVVPFQKQGLQERSATGR
jgi:ABC-type Fe3+ transport system substrate-binding protein